MRLNLHDFYKQFGKYSSAIITDQLISISFIIRELSDMCYFQMFSSRRFNFVEKGLNYVEKANTSLKYFLFFAETFKNTCFNNKNKIFGNIIISLIHSNEILWSELQLFSLKFLFKIQHNCHI